jgi:hypothetical protein
LDSVTFGDVYKQAATAAELDALSLAYQGETQAGSLLTEARITRAARPSWTQGVFQAVGAGLGSYAGAGGTFGTTTPPTTSSLVARTTPSRVPRSLLQTTPKRRLA